MELTNGMDISTQTLDSVLIRITDQIYKMLPTREEGEDWTKLLETLIIELTGMNDLLIGKQDILFTLLCKLKGLYSLQEEEKFLAFRRTIFDCLHLMNTLLASCH